jgi:hypothetical protein
MEVMFCLNGLAYVRDLLLHRNVGLAVLAEDR